MSKRRWRSKRRWSLIGVAILILGIGQLVANSWPIQIQAFDATADGPIFALVWSDGVWESRIVRWENDLSQREVLTTASRHQIGFHASGDATAVAVVRSDEIFGYDGQTGKRIWTIAKPHIVKTLSVGDQAYLMAACGGPGLDEFVLYDLKTGEEVDQYSVSFPQFPQRGENLYLDENRITVQLADGTLESFAFSEGTIERLPLPAATGAAESLGRLGKLFPRPRRSSRSVQLHKLPSATENTWVWAETDWEGDTRKISVGDIATRKELHRDRLGLSTLQRLGLLLLAGALTFVWIRLWSSRRRSAIDTNRPRGLAWVVRDALVLSALIIIPYWVISPFAPVEIRSTQWQKLLSVGGGAAIAITITALQKTKRPFYWWTIVLFSCTFPFLIPLVLVAVFSRWSGLSRVALRIAPGDSGQSNVRKLRFGIGEMLGATAAIALLMGMVTLSKDLLIPGVMVALWALVSLVLCVNQQIASLTLFVSVALSVTVACQDPRFPDASSAIAIMAMITMMLCHVRMACPPVRSTPETKRHNAQAVGDSI